MDPFEEIEDESSSESDDLPEWPGRPVYARVPVTGCILDHGAGVPYPAFDVALPTRHSYLGADLEEVSGCTLYDEHSIVSLPLLTQQQGTMALPGQVLPLSLFHPGTIALLRETVSKDRTFGLVSAIESIDNQDQDQHHDQTNHALVGTVGVTAETFEHRENADENRGYGLKARCRQRFKVLEVKAHQDSTMTGKVRILPEITLPPLLPQYSSSATMKVGSLSKRKMLNAAITPWPAWFYKQYDTDSLVKHLHKALEAMRVTLPMNETAVGPFRSSKADETLLEVPSDPIALSYWVAQNLPLVDSQRSNLLEINSTVHRLHWELSFLEKYLCICCQVCGEKLAAIGDTFSMSVEGPQGTYVNPSGYVHDTMTVKRVKNVITVGLPSSQHTWFPGYKWTIIDCSSCNSHVGWEFSASKLRPPFFWGLSRRSIVTLTENDPEKDSDEDSHQSM